MTGLGAIAIAVSAAVTVPILATAAPTPAPKPAAPTTSAPAPNGAAPANLAGKTVFLDPGHQGGTDGHALNKQVPDGRGGKKDCQTTGATSVDGVPEHTINWDVVQLVKTGLEGIGAKVVLSRPNDTGWGGCVDERAAAASAAHADVAVSVHADSTANGADNTHRGFHMIIPQLPIPDATVNQVQSTGGLKASQAMRDSFKAAGFTPANYAGVNDGLQTRSDIAGVNLTKVPDVFIEMGNLSNPTEAKTLGSKEGQVKYALAISNGIVRYLNGDKAAGPTTTAPITDSSSLLAAITNGPVGTIINKLTGSADTAPTTPTTPGTTPTSPGATPTTPGTTPTTPGTTTTQQQAGIPGLSNLNLSELIGMVTQLFATNKVAQPVTEVPGREPAAAPQAPNLPIPTSIPGLQAGKLPDINKIMGSERFAQAEDLTSQILRVMLVAVYQLNGGKLPF